MLTIIGIMQKNLSSDELMTVKNKMSLAFGECHQRNKCRAKIHWQTVLDNIISSQNVMFTDVMGTQSSARIEARACG